MALIVVLVITLLPAIVISSLVQQISDGNRATNYEAALAAAQAGVQEYRNLLNQYGSTYYWLYSGAQGQTIPATSGGPNPALYGWETVPNANPAEAFTYEPDVSQLTVAKTAATPFGGDILLVVTGQAGIGATRSYRRVEASFSLSGVLTDVYFSNFEQPGPGDMDQWENTYCTSVAASSGCPTSGLQSSGAEEYDEATLQTPSAYGAPESYAAALCQYDANAPNTFVDWYSQNSGHPVTPPDGYPGTAPYSASNPYYGPWYGNWPDPANPLMQFGNAPTSGRASGDTSACNENYYITGNTFNGPVYSQDELTTCGTPAFNGNPSLQTAVSASFPFPAGWPGTRPAIGGVSNPWGYIKDPWGDCGGSSSPTFPNAPLQFSVQQSLPPVETSLAATIQNGGTGCIYTGPTMIRFYWNASTSTETMDVWSPLTKHTYASGGAQCGAIDASGNGPGDLCGGTACTVNGSNVPTNTQVCQVAQAGICAVGQVMAGDFAQVTVTKPEVIWVQALPTVATDPNSWATVPTAQIGAAAANCIDPWITPGPTANISAQTCDEGDAIIGGAVGASLTLGAANNVVVSRSVVYGCAVNADGSYQNSVSNCAGSSNVLGLIANSSIWISRPLVGGVCPDDTDMPLTGVGAVGWSDIVPNCDISNPIIDGATAALSGFLEVQNWKEGSNNGTIYFNGSDAVNSAGQYGTFTAGGGVATGYSFRLNYDSRLAVGPPPDYVQATDSVWQVAGWVTCGLTSPNPDSNPSTGAGFNYNSWAGCSALPGSYAP